MRHLSRPTLLAAIATLGMAGTTDSFAAEYATVVSSTPVVAQVQAVRQVCTQGRQYVQQPTSGLGAVIGAVAGGVIGNSIGGGFGRAAATGLGVVAGSVAGNQVEAGGNPVVSVPTQRCEAVNRTESRVVGYDVVYDYAGQRYNTRMQRDPGQRFAVDVRPAASELPIESQPVPVYRSAAPVSAPVYVEQAQPAPVYYDPLPPPVYYGPRSAYDYPAPGYYGGPSVTIGIGYYGGYGGHGGYRGHHWH